MAEISVDPARPERDVDTVTTATGRALIGKPLNHWLHSTNPPTFDLTRPKGPDFPIPAPRSAVRVKTTTSDIFISPVKSALVIIDMQNFFLSPSLGRDPDGAGNKARQTLLDTTIPAARKAGIRVIWVNWGLTDADLDGMPPSVRRSFGFEQALHHDANPHSRSQALLGETLDGQEGFPDSLTSSKPTESTKPKILYRGLGSSIGTVKLADGSTVDGGRLLFADTWNADLTSDLRDEYERGLSATPPDVWIHKNRMSGLHGTSSTDLLEKEGITTLLFAGVNTDQCVGGSLTDAFSKGYDCILVKDACGTTSPQYATDSWEYNCARTYGFVMSSADLLQGAQDMVRARNAH